VLGFPFGFQPRGLPFRGAKTGQIPDLGLVLEHARCWLFHRVPDWISTAGRNRLATDWNHTGRRGNHHGDRGYSAGATLRQER